jgi:hypothetical protein
LYIVVIVLMDVEPNKLYVWLVRLHQSEVRVHPHSPKQLVTFIINVVLLTLASWQFQFNQLNQPNVLTRNCDLMNVNH